MYYNREIIHALQSNIISKVTGLFGNDMILRIILRIIHEIWSIINAEKLQEILNRTMQGIMSIITSALQLASI